MANLAGRAKMKLMFDAEGGKQRVRVDAMADQVKIDSLALQSARVDMTAIDPIGALSLNGKVEVAGFDGGAVTVSKAALVARPSRDGTDFTLDGPSKAACWPRRRPCRDQTARPSSSSPNCVTPRRLTRLRSRLPRRSPSAAEI